MKKTAMKGVYITIEDHETINKIKNYIFDVVLSTTEKFGLQMESIVLALVGFALSYGIDKEKLLQAVEVCYDYNKKNITEGIFN